MKGSALYCKNSVHPESQPYKDSKRNEFEVQDVQAMVGRDRRCLELFESNDRVTSEIAYALISRAF